MERVGPSALQDRPRSGSRLEAAETRAKGSPDVPAARQAIEVARFKYERALSSFHSFVTPDILRRAAAELGHAGQDTEYIAQDALTSLHKHRAGVKRSAWGYLVAVVRNRSKDLKKEISSRVPFEEDVAEASRSFKRK